MSSGTKSSKVTPPSPTYMSNKQFASYLSDLRTNRTARPGGARPLPPSGRSSMVSSPSLGRHNSFPQQVDLPVEQTFSQAPTIGDASICSRNSISSLQSRDYYPASPSKPLKPSDVVPTATYIERGQRWMEKEEASSLRDAMEQMDIRGASRNVADDDESRIYNAALDEAAELVWQHEQGYKPPKPDGPYRYRPHLRKNSYAHARTASVGAQGDDVAPSAVRHTRASRSESGSSAGSCHSIHGHRASVDSAQATAPSDRKPPNPCAASAVEKRLARRRSSLKRNISGGVQRPFSGDQIWEEPEAAATTVTASADGRASPDKLNNTPQSPLNRGGRAGHPISHPAPDIKSLNRIEIYRNPPTQSRNPLYTTNTGSSKAEEEPELERKNGVEVRSEDIRAATSRKLKDRSTKLPEPTAVSDSPGRPIVSFDSQWKAPEETTDISPDRLSKTAHCNVKGQSQQQEQQQVSREPMAIPCINVAEVDPPQPKATHAKSVPSISVTGDDDDSKNVRVPTINVPTISVNDDTSTRSAPSTMVEAPMLGNKPTGNSRPLPSPSVFRNMHGRAQLPRGHWSPAAGSTGRPKTTCHECGFPIEGRFVSLAGLQERFHPQCFSCYCCGTSLEAMEISPEPDLMRKARLERIRRRATGETLDEAPGMTALEDGDDRLRFYCHLDWHELFAPRCKHCKTPIIGEHIVALGDHWHYGHFFCAECGDPFEHGMTHIEKDGYAWCIKCQTKRTERRAPKCKMCKMAVIGEYVQALGGEWHERCFRCADCGGGFEDGQIFPKEVGGPGGVMVVLCTGCRRRDLKR